jgi:uncharacterized membrane protein
LIVPIIVFGLIGAVLFSLTEFGAGSLSPDSVTSINSSDSGISYTTDVTTLSGAGLAVMLVGSIVLLVVGAVFSSAYYGGLLDIADGRQVQIGSFFKPRNLGQVIIISLIVGLVSGLISGLLGAVLPILGSILGGLIALVITVFTVFAVIACIDRNLAPIDAIKASVNLVTANFGQVLLVLVVAYLLLLVGALLCLVGLLVAAPVAALMITYAYRRLSGGPVAPLTP